MGKQTKHQTSLRLSVEGKRLVAELAMKLGVSKAAVWELAIRKLAKSEEGLGEKMGDLIQALQILQRYTDKKYPTNCSHDELWVEVDPDLVSKEDVAALAELSFVPSDGGFVSFRFGSC